VTTPADLTDEQLLAEIRAAETTASDPETVLGALRDVTAAHLEAARRPNPFAALADPDDDDLLLASPPFPVDSCSDLSVLADSQTPRPAADPHSRQAGADATITLSTTQAAAILGISRATVVRYCDTGRLPYMQPGKHRRLRHADVLAFKDATTHGQVAS
jgi:excisionase family DNA binding protein